VASGVSLAHPAHIPTAPSRGRLISRPAIQIARPSHSKTQIPAPEPSPQPPAYFPLYPFLRVAALACSALSGSSFFLGLTEKWQGFSRCIHPNGLGTGARSCSRGEGHGARGRGVKVGSSCPTPRAMPRETTRSQDSRAIRQACVHDPLAYRKAQVIVACDFCGAIKAAFRIVYSVVLE
jgi:hypothetical protein